MNKESISLIINEPEPIYIDLIKRETNYPKDSINLKMDKILSNINIQNYYEIKGEGYLIKILPINERTDNFIEFLSCEKKIRNFYHYTDDKKLILFQTEIDTDNEIWINNKIEYAIFNENKEQLNLSICLGEEIQIHYKIKNQSKLNLTKISYFDEIGINIFNISEPFFNDICFPYSENGFDIILSDRIKYFYQNYSICQNDCIYEKIEIDKKNILCKCFILTEIKQKVNKNKNSKFILLSNSTLGVIKCYDLVFNFKNKFKNLGFWTTIFCLCSKLIFYSCFIIIGINPIQKYIKKEMSEYHYLPNNNKIKETNGQNYSYNNKNNKENSFSIKNSRKIIKSRTIHISKNRENINALKNAQSQNELIISSKAKGILINKEKKNNQLNYKDYYMLIKIDANNKNEDKEPYKSNYILDNYDYNLALKYEKRSFGRIFYIILLSKEETMNVIFFKSPLHLIYLRIHLFFLMLGGDFCLNALLYFNERISDQYRYIYLKYFWYTIYNNIIVTILCTFLNKMLLFFLHL